MIKTPAVRRGIMGWKLSRIDMKEQSGIGHYYESHKSHKKHNSAFRNVSTDILQNSYIGKKRRFISNKQSIDDSNKSYNDKLGTSVVLEHNNQIINLKAPAQFNRPNKIDANSNYGEVSMKKISPKTRLPKRSKIRRRMQPKILQEKEWESRLAINQKNAVSQENDISIAEMEMMRQSEAEFSNSRVNS